MTPRKGIFEGLHGLGWRGGGLTEVAIHPGFGAAVGLHQRCDECTLLAFVPQWGHLRPRELPFPAEVYALLAGLPNPIHLPLGTYRRFELRNGAHDMEHQAAGRITGVEMVSEPLQVHLL